MPENYRVVMIIDTNRNSANRDRPPPGGQGGDFHPLHFADQPSGGQDGQGARGAGACGGRHQAGAGLRGLGDFARAESRRGPASATASSVSIIPHHRRSECRGLRVFRGRYRRPGPSQINKLVLPYFAWIKRILQ